MSADEKKARAEWKGYRDLIAEYLHANYARHGITVYTEVGLGKTIIGKNRKADVFLVRFDDQRAMALECKFQESTGTADEKMPYALEDLEALWIPGCLVYGGSGWSPGVLQMLRAARRAAYCLPARPELARTAETRELDHVVAAVFGLWDYVLKDHRRLRPDGQMELPGLAKSRARATKREKPGKVGSGDG